MTTRLALVLFVLIATLIGLDLYAGWGGTLAGARAFTDLLRTIAFWR
ncbi:hypothetical protein [Wenxinia saemankumensis]|uniref:Uncharacterized protein n=1 Tax=Wenxinia saemankumensis TaxID=1447782 RepID=A0A1M6GRH2_9RHOB|nr:hypothetical protein [Wenxinia saemankumensis]SHJ12518.1 hypothetical protein SAMN05444417_2877 [Wenxinia saemankumensis]